MNQAILNILGIALGIFISFISASYFLNITMLKEIVHTNYELSTCKKNVDILLNK